MVRKVLCLFFITLTLAGCAAPEPTPAPQVGIRLGPLSPLPTPSPYVEPEPSPTPTVPSPVSHDEEALSRAVRRAVADLSRRLGIPEEEIEVVSATREEMPVQDVECGRPESRIVLPAFVMGIEVVLSACGQTYVYRGRGEMLNLCPPESEGLPPFILEKIRELFEDYPPEEVKIVLVEQVTWPDTSLGCPEPGKFYAQVLVPGYRVVVEVGGRKFEVHTDLRGRVVICNPCPKLP